MNIYEVYHIKYSFSSSKEMDLFLDFLYVLDSIEILIYNDYADFYADPYELAVFCNEKRIKI